MGGYIPNAQLKKQIDACELQFLHLGLLSHLDFGVLPGQEPEVHLFMS
jgi:hypothetical protein